MSHVSRRGTRRREPGSRWLPVTVAVLTMRGHFIPLKDTPAGTDGERDELGARHGLPCPRGLGGRRPPLMDSAGRPAGPQGAVSAPLCSVLLCPSWGRGAPSCPRLGRAIGAGARECPRCRRSRLSADPTRRSREGELSSGTRGPLSDGRFNPGLAEPEAVFFPPPG